MSATDRRTPSTPAAGDYGSAFPASRKVYVEGRHGVRVPMREIELSGGEPPLRVYDTSGPLGADVRQGLPPLRAEARPRALPPELGWPARLAGKEEHPDRHLGRHAARPGRGSALRHAANAADARQLRAGIPDDVLIADWQYDLGPAYPSLGLFRAAGSKTLACSWWSPENVYRLAQAAR